MKLIWVWKLMRIEVMVASGWEIVVLKDFSSVKSSQICLCAWLLNQLILFDGILSRIYGLTRRHILILENLRNSLRFFVQFIPINQAKELKMSWNKKLWTENHLQFSVKFVTFFSRKRFRFFVECLTNLLLLHSTW